ADHVSLVDPERIEHGTDIVARARLRISLEVLRHVGRRIAARVVGDAAVASREVTQLGLPAAVVAAELMNEHDRRAGAGLLVVKLDAVVGSELGHVAFYGDESRSLQAVRAAGYAHVRRVAFAQGWSGRGGRVGQGRQRQFPG